MIFYWRTYSALKILTGKSNLKLNSSVYKNMNMNIWVVGTSNWLFLRCSKTGKKFPKK